MPPARGRRPHLRWQFRLQRRPRWRHAPIWSSSSLLRAGRHTQRCLLGDESVERDRALRELGDGASESGARRPSPRAHQGASARSPVFDPTLHLAEVRFSGVRVTDAERADVDPARAREFALMGMATCRCLPTDSGSRTRASPATAAVRRHGIH
ncbi:hypothetical protein RHCRD62_20175 [Rhodococcus sp. RD6.2]|nr:hypothetical protein RHCRD62_20175 [Rhodococcus sp. RD6.2]